MIFKSCSRPKTKRAIAKRNQIIELGKNLENHISDCTVDDCRTFVSDIVKVRLSSFLILFNPSIRRLLNFPKIKTFVRIIYN